MAKAMTLRLDDDQAEELEKVAEIDGVAVAEAVRQAIAEHVASRSADPEFRKRLRASIKRHQAILDRLAK
jgi:hypothetical protein